MSTISPTTTLAEPSASTSTSTPASNSETTTLYLFTFLATILILVLLSSSLVLRSYILRRRYRRRFQQALADGLFVDLDRSTFNEAGQFDPLGFRRSTRQLGPKPVVWDTWTHPADKVDTWSSITPVAVQCTPLLSPPSTPVSSPQPSTAPLGALRAQSLLSQLRVRSPFSLSPNLSPIGSPTRPPPPGAPTPPDPSARNEKDAAMLAVCVLVAMPDVSAPVHRPAPDPKGKGVDPLESQTQDADSPLPSPLPRGARIPDTAADEEGLPVLEFGVVEMRTGEWALRT